jgi:hypothetical protein
MLPSKEQSEWVERVLNVRVEQAASPQEALKASLTALVGKAGKIADAARPSAPPRQLAAGRLLNAIAEKPAPADPAEAPAHVADFLPGFLVSIETDRPVASQVLEAGAAVPQQDQMLGIADLFAAVQRSMIEWENLLDQAENKEETIDSLEDLEAERDEKEYAATLTAYNARRNDSMTAEARALKLMAELQVKFNSLSDSQKVAAVKENSDA